jgi:DNA-binding SARP family transcriptional activator
VLDPEGAERLLSVEKATETTIYALAERQRIWTDLDEFETLLDRAACAQRRADDPVLLLEQAYQLSRKDFLEDERNSEWAEERRREVQAAQHRCVHWLATLYQERSLDELAEALFQQVFEQNPADEDVLYALMGILARQGRSQEALRLYRRCARDLQETVHRRPAKRVRELAEHIQNEPVALERKPPTASVPARTQSLSIPHVHEQPEETGLSRRTHEPQRRERESIVVPGPLNRMKTDDPVICYGFMQAYIIKLVYRWNLQEHCFSELQDAIGQEIRRCDQMQPQSPRSNEQEWRLSRRQALITLAGLATALLFRLQQNPDSASAAEEFLSLCAASISACWQLMSGNEFAVVEHVLSEYVPRLEALAKPPSRYQKTAADLASQGYLLRGLLSLHRNDLQSREWHHEQAVQYARITEDGNLQVAAFIHQASTYYYLDSPTQTLRTYQRALAHVNGVSPLLRSRVYIGLAGAYALCEHEQEALRFQGLAHEAFAEHSETQPRMNYLYGGIGPSQLWLWGGLTHLDLDHPRDAWDAFASLDNPQASDPVPERVRLEIRNHQAETAIALRDLDLFCAYIEMGITGADALGSQKRRSEAVDIYKQALKVWSNEPRVKALRGLFVK